MQAKTEELCPGKGDLITTPSGRRRAFRKRGDFTNVEAVSEKMGEGADAKPYATTDLASRKSLATGANSLAMASGARPDLTARCQCARQFIVEGSQSKLLRD